MFIKTEKNTAITLSILFVGMLIFSALYTIRPRTIKTCSEYTSQKEAQKDLFFNPRLDGFPKDGKACNSYHY